jgi:hypothetical protein
MKTTLPLAVTITLALLSLGGCACTDRVPVSLEPLNNWLLCHGPATWHYPFSCPPCPYCCTAGVTDEAVPVGQQPIAVSPQRPDRDVRTGEKKSEASRSADAETHY